MTSSENPYKAPESEVAGEMSSVSGAIVPVGKGPRFLNFIIDYIMQIIVFMVILIVVGFVGGEAVVRAMENMPDIVFGVSAMLIYYVTMEALFQRTIGKMITGTKVVNEKGAKPSFGQIVGRTFARMIPFEAFSFLNSDARGWHDTLPKTYVIKSR